MENNIFGERFILISENKKYFEVANFVRKFSGLKETTILSKGILRVGTYISSVFGWLIPILKMMNKVNVEALTSQQEISSEKIKNQLNFEFIPVKDSLDFHFKNYKNSQKKI